MQIDEAIEELQAIKKKAEIDGMPYGAEAIQLGIEALKRVRDYKEAHFNLHYTPMPGETEE